MVVACGLVFVSMLTAGSSVKMVLVVVVITASIVLSDPPGSGRVGMLTSPVAAARAVVATGAWVKSKHDMYLIRGSVGA